MSEARSTPVYLGMTRPPMAFGVTFAWAVAEGMATVLLFLASGTLLGLALIAPLHLLGLWACRKDPRFLEIVAAYGMRCTGVRSRRFWGRNSYSG
jgi:type IV secretion system protein VirB3